MKHTWIPCCLAAAALVSACGSKPKPGTSSLTEKEIAILNSGPQREYPEFTLAAQAEAMARIEAERRRARIEGLRERIPPADWIETAYHGLAVDANHDVIEMDRETVTRMQESLFEILHEPAREKAIQAYGDDPGVLFHDREIQGEDRLVVRGAVLTALLEVSDAGLRARYAERHRLIRQGANRAIGREYIVDPAISERFRRFRFPEDWFVWPRPSSAYVHQCRAAGVPIPPDWPDPRWISQGPLVFVFISATLTAEVYAYEDPAVPGVCYALPRRTDAVSIALLGIICQSDTTGKACFWDNKTVAGIPITGPDVTLDIDTIGNGSTLAETCTQCHRGYNAFNIHPGTALDLGRATAVGGPYDTDPAVRFTPIARAHWSNPGPLLLPPPAPGQSACTACHELPQMAGSAYCSAVLQNAAKGTMPPFGTARAGWPPTANAMWADHIGRLSGCP
jgi:hypothetical protein